MAIRGKSANIKLTARNKQAMNKLIAFIIFLPLFAVGQNTKYIDTADKLKEYFSKIHGQDSVKYQMLFFTTFPDNFTDFNGVFGYCSNEDPSKYYASPLYDGHEYIFPFFYLKTIPERDFYQKIINIAIGGHWEADAINYFQRNLHGKILQNPKLTFDLLKSKSDTEIKSFFFFFFHGIHPIYETIPDKLKKMKTYDSRIYKLLEQGFKDAIKQSGH